MAPKILHDSSLHDLKEILDITSKKVAIIGNAESIFHEKRGSIIDMHDIVIRINKGGVNDVAYQGTRTDYICLSLLLEIDELKQFHKTGKVIWMTPKRAKLSNDFLAHVTPMFYPRKMWWKLFYQLGKHRPSTGLMAIDLVNACTPKNISLFGFDFKKTKTFYDPVNYLGPHNWNAEKEWVEKHSSANYLTIN